MNSVVARRTELTTEETAGGKRVFKKRLRLLDGVGFADPSRVTNVFRFIPGLKRNRKIDAKLKTAVLSAAKVIKNYMKCLVQLFDTGLENQGLLMFLIHF